MFSKRLFIPLTVAAFSLVMSDSSLAADANYDEAKVGNHPLPDPLRMENGQKVSSPEQWKEQRRPELLNLFRQHVYGRSPGKPDNMRFEIQATSASNAEKKAIGGKATRYLASITFNDSASPKINVLIYVPNNVQKPVPAFLGLNFQGNHTISDDPGIPISTNWVRNNSDRGARNNRSSEEARGVASSRWPVEKIVDAGYALVTAYYGDIDPDFHDGFKNGVHPLFYKEGQTAPAPDEWGSIAAWAWGLSRIMDLIETKGPAALPIDESRVVVMGHSRLGKTALWAGAEDERFAIVISNNSGCGGAALSKRNYGETVGRINSAFPHWFCGNFKKYSNNEGALPVDQHQLIALMAPRPVYVASAVEDRWADPKGEFLGAKLAEPVYKLLGEEGLPAERMPELNQPAMGTIGYHIREGKHDVTDFDWDQYIQFANKHLGRK